MTVNKLPESLLEETVKDRFQSMLMDFKEQGSTEEQLQEMATPEKYTKYKEISLPNAEKIVKLGLAFRDIAERENIKVQFAPPFYMYSLDIKWLSTFSRLNSIGKRKRNQRSIGIDSYSSKTERRAGKKEKFHASC